MMGGDTFWFSVAGLLLLTSFVLLLLAFGVIGGGKEKNSGRAIDPMAPSHPAKREQAEKFNPRLPERGIGSDAVGASRGAAPKRFPPDPPPPFFEATPLQVAPPPAPVVRRWADADRVRESYNRLAAEAAPALQRAFIAEWSVEPVSPGLGGVLEPAESSPVWWIQSSTRPEDGFLAPSWGVIRDWAKFYRDLGGATARDAFGELYEIGAGPTLQIIKLAEAERIAGGFRLTTKGALQGVL
jgi:hypothetical protein